MKGLKKELRMWLAEKLVNWAYDILPYDEDGHKMKKHIVNYYLEKVKEEQGHN
jgi:hypothetical protein